MDSGLPVKRTIADQVAELVRQRILTGQLKGGQPIRQEHLAAELGVSRIPLREALKQLAAEGFVTIASHKGAVVAELSIAEVEELFDIRLRLETWLLQLAISAMTERDLARAREEHGGAAQAGRAAALGRRQLALSRDHVPARRPADHAQAAEEHPRQDRPLPAARGHHALRLRPWRCASMTA